MASVAGEFEWFSDWAADVSPLYERLARGITSDRKLLEIASEAPSDQPSPNLLFGAVHSLLLSGSRHRLTAFYPTCCDDPTDPAERDPFPAFRAFVFANESEIRRIVGSRRVQTNEVGRSAVLFPAFKHLVQTRAQAPLALVEIGTSAGLNLYWDRFRYEYAGYGTYGDRDSPVRIDSNVRGDADPPFWDAEPDIARRIGIDVNALDVTDPRDARWLRALVIPDHRRRFERLESAIGMVRQDPPRLVEGNALEILSDVLAAIPIDYDVCVFSTLVLYQFTEDEVSALRELLRNEAARRTIHWLSNDPSEAQTPPVYRYVSFGSDIQEHQLSEYKAHGEWIRWLASTGAPA